MIAKHLERIERSLSDFENGRLSLEGLQKNIEGELGVLEGPFAARLIECLGNFANQLELFIYSQPEQKRVEMASEAIRSLRGVLGECTEKGEGKSGTDN